MQTRRVAARLSAVLAGVAASVVVGAGPAQAQTPYEKCQPTSTGAGVLCVTVTPAGTVNPDTTATVTGTVTCPVGYFYYGNVRVWQDYVGPNAKVDQVLVGSVNQRIPCTGLPQEYSVTTRTKGYHPGSARFISYFVTRSPSGDMAVVQVDTRDTAVLV